MSTDPLLENDQEEVLAALRLFLSDGLTAEQAAILVRKNMGQPDKRWLDELLKIARAEAPEWSRGPRSDHRHDQAL